jgi:hypothetical protein
MAERDGSGVVPGWSGHTITLEFEGGYAPRLKLHCPPGVICSTGSTCGGCGRDVDAPDDDGERCYDCPEPGSPRECWVKSWTDNLSADEVLSGTVVLPVTTSFDGDSLTLEIAAVPEGPA